MKMGKAATVSVLALAVACAMPALSDIVLENDAFKLVVGDDWIRMYRYASSAAWGAPLWRGMPQYDSQFAIALRLVGHDMKATNYLDTGHLNYQVPPSWWIDNY